MFQNIWVFYISIPYPKVCFKNRLAENRGYTNRPYLHDALHLTDRLIPPTCRARTRPSNPKTKHQLLPKPISLPSDSRLLRLLTLAQEARFTDPSMGISYSLSYSTLSSCPRVQKSRQLPTTPTLNGFVACPARTRPLAALPDVKRSKPTRCRRKQVLQPVACRFAYACAWLCACACACAWPCACAGALLSPDSESSESPVGIEGMGMCWWPICVAREAPRLLMKPYRPRLDTSRTPRSCISHQPFPKRITVGRDRRIDAGPISGSDTPFDYLLLRKCTTTSR